MYCLPPTANGTKLMGKRPGADKPVRVRCCGEKYLHKVPALAWRPLKGSGTTPYQPRSKILTGPWVENGLVILP